MNKHQNKTITPLFNPLKVRYLLAPPFLMSILFLSACTGLPDNVKPIEHFSEENFQGKWYEIARLDHSFERDLEQVSANYEARDDGGIRVINRGFNSTTQEWKEAEGKAYFIDKRNTGHLKVSFFGPFYSSYIVFEQGPLTLIPSSITENNKNDYAFVSGYNTNYLWLLSRQPKVSEAIKTRFIQQATLLGYPVEDIIWVNQAAQ